ncbi:GNAT family N-acetyltransferase [Longirhabdus pacifica]|uniref:GNAT family N-acetyltransferase n=1 Tax=Longirhabdus pacifica TaxID=2305227 RepID=UPI0010088BDB|nr:GNAT family protein [Longirhabdus pacifica]
MVKLECFEKSDYNQLIDWIDSPAFLLQWGGIQFTYPLTEEQLDQYMEKLKNDKIETFVYKVVDQSSGEGIGHITLGKIDRENKTARVGKVLVGSKDVRGKGIGEQMMTEVLKVAFDELQLYKVTLGVFDFNHAAIACYEKVGFKKEGLRDHSIKYGDEDWNILEMFMVEDDWHNKA